MMETTDYCDYKLSLALKACGFDEPCDHYYAYDEESKIKHLLISASPSEWDWNYSALPESVHPECSAPSLYHAQKWLREKKKIDILVYNGACGYGWDVSKANNGTGLILFDEKGDDENSGCWTSYEAALSAGIYAALERIKKGE